MKNGKYLILLFIFIVAIFTITAANAEDNISDNIVGSKDNLEVAMDESITNSLSAGEDSEKVMEDTTKTSEIKKSDNSKSVKKTTFKTISKGSKDKAMVKKIQKALKKNGCYIQYRGHYLKVDGYYGPYTFKSVKHFQKDNKLKVTGKVDKKTAIKLKIIDNSNSVIKFDDNKPFIKEYNSGKSFKVKITNKKTGKGLETLLGAYYYKNGKKVNDEKYYTDKKGINYITPDDIEVGTYKLKVTCVKPKNIKAQPKYKKIIIEKTSIRLKVKITKSSDKENVIFKVHLKFKNNNKVNEGKVKFVLGDESYTVDVHKGLASKNINLRDVKSDKFKVTFLGTRNINSKTETGELSL